MVELRNKNQTVHIYAGELVSYLVDGKEYIHQKGSPGWRNSDTEMFPIIGPLAEANFQIDTPNGIAVQDQHGLLRELEYDLISKTDVEVVFRKSYRKNTPVKNSKYPQKSKKEFLFWTYDFKFEKKFVLSEAGLEILFDISSEKEAPFMLGYHPAFNLVTKNPVVIANSKTITLQDVLAVGSRALPILKCNKLILKDQSEVIISTTGFEHFMLWTEVSNMICIEPITFYPYAVNQQELNKGFQYLSEIAKAFKVQIQIKS